MKKATLALVAFVGLSAGWDGVADVAMNAGGIIEDTAFGQSVLTVVEKFGDFPVAVRTVLCQTKFSETRSVGLCMRGSEHRFKQAWAEAKQFYGVSEPTFSQAYGGEPNLAQAR